MHAPTFMVIFFSCNKLQSTTLVQDTSDNVTVLYVGMFTSMLEQNLLFLILCYSHIEIALQYNDIQRFISATIVPSTKAPYCREVLSQLCIRTGVLFHSSVAIFGFFVCSETMPCSSHLRLVRLLVF